MAIHIITACSSTLGFSRAYQALSLKTLHGSSMAQSRLVQAEATRSACGLNVTVFSATFQVPLVDWMSDTCHQGYTDLQSPDLFSCTLPGLIAKCEPTCVCSVCYLTEFTETEICVLSPIWSSDIVHKQFNTIHMCTAVQAELSTCLLCHDFIRRL